ncbi:MAG: response regulator [Clostridiales Family XIII bacterium]|jgi:signal transduction histidine kinase|nr:response regulator [Clostridiales Family XIII bacterium]
MEPNELRPGIRPDARPKLTAEAMEALAEYAGIGYFHINIPTGDIYLNHVITKLTGYEPGDIPHTSDTKFMLTFEEDRPRVFAEMAALDRGEKDEYSIQYRMRRVDGSVVSIKEHAIVLERDADGHVVRLAGLGQDMSQLIWAEEKARDMEKEVRRLAKNAAQGELADQNRLLRAANSAAAMIIGGVNQDYETVLRQAISILGESVQTDSVSIWRNREVDGRMHFFRRCHWEKTGYISDEYASVLYDSDTVFPGWREHTRQDEPILAIPRDLPDGMRDFPGIERVKSFMFIPLTLHGEFWGTVTFADYNNERLFTEDEADIMGAGTLVVASSISRNETFKKLNEARAKAMAGTKAKGEFLSRMSHEIRTPMNAIIGMTKIAEKTDDFEKVKDCLEKIDTSSEQLLDIINDVLDMSKIEADKMEIVNEPFDFADMLRHVSSVVGIKVDEKKQRLTFEQKKPFTHEVIGDRLRISQVLINLLGNANKFTPDGGAITVRISTSLDDNTNVALLIEVQDNGIGVSPDKLPGLFDSFEQADGSISRKYGGTGLGLAITKNLIELMGGKIAVESEEGKGTCFRFTIEIGWGEPLPEGSGEDQIPAGNVLAPSLGGKRLLIAEDIEINQEIVASVLEETGAELCFADNGKLAVDLFVSDPLSFDLIFMDIQMPEMDGLTATSLIRASGAPNAKTIPIVAMTANAFKEDAENSLKAGMNGHIAKPIAAKDLYGVLRKYLL